MCEVPSSKEYHRGSCDIVTELRKNKGDVVMCRRSMINNKICSIAPDDYSPCSLCKPEKIMFW